MLGDLYTRRGENGQPAKIALCARSCYGDLSNDFDRSDERSKIA